MVRTQHFTQNVSESSMHKTTKVGYYINHDKISSRIITHDLEFPIFDCHVSSNICELPAHLMKT